MEKYFGIKYQFDKKAVQERIDEFVDTNKKAYICVADGVSVATVNRSERLKTVFEEADISVCDSGWIPMFINLVYGIKREQYTGSDLFRDIIHKKRYKMMFLGSSKQILDSLRNNLLPADRRISGMQFVELPFCNVEDFDYQLIAEQINRENPDIIWVSLGMPKQEIFMHAIKPFIHRGILIGVGAAFKFHSGLKDQKRAPAWMIRSKLEWLHRIFSEPKKQISRCFLIVRTIPGMLYHEYKTKKRKNVF